MRALRRAAALVAAGANVQLGSDVLLHRLFSSTPEPLLYREFIQQSLYHPTQGYFNRPQPPIRRLAEPINFNRLANRADFNEVLRRVYQQLQVDWLTPVEVFAPWYGRALARYMLEARQYSLNSAHQPLTIVEIGGGTGTLAASVLDYIAEKHPITYSYMRYTTIEISATLAEQQAELVAKQRGHAQAWRLVRADATQPGAWAELAASLPPQHSLSQHCFVLMMEVLDNLPHDRVVRASPDAPWQQVAVDIAPQQQRAHSSSSKHPHQQQAPGFSEVLQPAADPLILRCLEALGLQGHSSSDSSSNSSSGGGGGLRTWLQAALGLPTDEGVSAVTDVWLPTRALQLLELLHTVLPAHTLLAADFDALPDVVVPGRCAPLVSGRDGPGVGRDYSSVLVPWGAADIFFPTRFEDLGRLYAAAAEAGPRLNAAAAAAAAAAEARRPGAAVAAGRAAALARGTAAQHQQQDGGSSCSSSHASTAEFMSAFAEAKHTRTLSGYNPLVQDWQNTRVFVGQAGRGGSG